MRNVLGLAKRTKARILQASTSGVYGEPYVPKTDLYTGLGRTIGWFDEPLRGRINSQITARSPARR